MDVLTEPGKLLLADDDFKNLNLVLGYFKEEAYTVLYAPNGEAAVTIAAKEQPDVILMDWAMPVMNGIDATLKLKLLDETKQIPVIMATGMMTRPEDLQKALEAGAMDYLRKPFDPVELTARVQSALRLGRTIQHSLQQHREIKALLEKERAYMHRELEQKERELTLYAVYEHERNQLLIDLREQVKAVEQVVKGQPAKQLEAMRRQIAGNITAEESWDNFTVHFEQVHPDFFRKLKVRFEELTPHDLLIASYVKIGMDNKEIARISGVQPGSVKSNINRLKKRMGLPAEASIRDFIMTL